MPRIPPGNRNTGIKSYDNLTDIATRGSDVTYAESMKEVACLLD